MFSGHSVVRFHANTEVKDGKLKLNDIKINLNLGDVDVHIKKSQDPALGKDELLLNDNRLQVLISKSHTANIII